MLPKVTRHFARVATSRLRPLPRFIILGAQKAGTTSLYDDLCRHPQIRAAARKEVHFFDVEFDRGLAWYRSQFPVWHPGTMTGEASPYYLGHPHAARRIMETIPDVRAIVLLRDPVDRAYSHYQHAVRKGREPLTFRQAIEAEPERLRGEWDRMLADESYSSMAYRRQSYLTRGRYADQLERVFAVMHRGQVLPIYSDAYFRHPAAVLRRITDFLELAPWAPKTFAKRNAFSYDPIDPLLRAELAGRFADQNRRLGALVGQTPPWCVRVFDEVHQFSTPVSKLNRGVQMAPC